MHSTFPSFYDDIIHRNQRRTENHSQRYLPSHPASLSFSDNDYLGLSRHPSVRQSAVKAVQDFGTSASAARLLAGSSPIHRQLEKSLASWKSTEQALLFSAGYLTPLGVIPAIIGPKDRLFWSETPTPVSLTVPSFLVPASVYLIGRTPKNSRRF